MPTRQEDNRGYQWPIPQDWNGQDWTCCLLWWPDSPQWTAIVRGTLEHLKRGRSWDAATGSIVDVQQIAKFIPLTFMPSPEVRALPEVAEIMSCLEDIVTELREIKEAIQDGNQSGGEGLSELAAIFGPEFYFLVKSVKEAARILGADDLPILPPPPGE